jgi:hypothetical protein
MASLHLMNAQIFAFNERTNLALSFQIRLILRCSLAMQLASMIIETCHSFKNRVIFIC